ncbi:hypothetical protein QPK87_18265 [Kamptonema cortianum]|nr:hypothetical protein [Geitlerinema splendidum]MDK3158502.1 hypothetical protein [Kamptonema cortianum]
MTAQGFYVIAADGSPFGFSNHRSPERLLAFLRSGYEQFESHKSNLNSLAPLKRNAPQPPIGASVLRVYSRISPVPPGSDVSNTNIHRDHLWVLADEFKAMQRGDVPASLIRRLARYTLVDAVRGEPDFWKPMEVEKAQLSVSGTGELRGSFKMQTKDETRGIELTLEGKLISSESRPVLKIYAEGMAWGAGRYTPKPPPGKFGIRFAIVQPASNATLVPPQGVLGGDYLNPQ